MVRKIIIAAVVIAIGTVTFAKFSATEKVSASPTEKITPSPTDDMI